ncbi:MAG TPA: hypothetical protein VFG95_06220, partial [Nitrospiria bacterium]|nr:hypothetical protein [Nitrospiria bacterium]
IHTLIRIVKRTILILPVLASLAGCGGGSGPLGLSAEPIRILSPGDSWTYTVSGNATKLFPDGSGVSGNFNGTMVRKILTTTLSDHVGATCQVLDETWDILIPTGRELLNFQQCFSQDSDGRIFLHGNSDPIRGLAVNPVSRFVVDPAVGSFLILNSPVGVGDAVELGPATFDDAATTDGSYTIPIREKVPLAIKTFDAFRMETNTRQVSGGTAFTIQVTRWMVPQLGTEVKEEGMILKEVASPQHTDTLVFTAVLTASTVSF